jgi:adenylate cyclase
MPMRNLGSRLRNLRQSVLTVGGTVVLSSLVVTGLIVGWRELKGLQGMELAAFDYLMRSRPDEGPDERFLVVGIDDTDIQTRKEYPITDATLAQVLTKLEAQEARIIGIDILRDIQQGTAAGRIELVNLLTDNDKMIAACALSQADSPGIAAAPGVTEERVGVADFPVDPGGTVRQGMIMAIPQTSQLPAVSEHICNYANPENQLPSLSFQMVVRYLDAMGIEPELTEFGELKFGSTVLRRLTPKSGGYHNIDTGNYQMLLNYRSARNAVRQVSLSDVLADKVDPDWIKDKIVMIGYTAAVVKDTFYTPFSAGSEDSQKMPGVIIHAQNASQILSAVLDQRPLLWYWNRWQEGLWIFVWSLVGGLLANQIRKPWLLVLGTGVAIAILSGTAYIIFLQAGWIPLVPSALGLIVTATSVVLIDRHAATIVKTVKGFLKINIEIDEEKKNQEVAAITESDYFLELQNKAKDLRVRENTDIKPQIISYDEAVDSYDYPAMQPKSPEVVVSTPATEIDYLQQVRDRRNKLNTPANNTATNNLEIIQAQTTDEDQEEIEYLEQLQRRSKKFRENRK